MPDSRPQPIMVFIENEAGSDTKHHYNEQTFEVERTERVAALYPFPYGFIPNTIAPDGDAADCFVITTEELRTGDLLQCEPLALLEQSEAGDIDHNVIAVPIGEPLPDLEKVSTAIATFAQSFRRDDPSADVVIGALQDATESRRYIAECAAVFKSAKSADR